MPGADSPDKLGDSQPDDPASDQLALIGPRGGLLPRPAKRASARQPAPRRPIARVLLDSPLRRLDRTFDYLVPVDLDATAGVGCKVRVKFGRQRLEGWVLERAEQAEHTGMVRWLDAVVAKEPVFTDAGLALIRRVTEHYAGTMSDVFRLAIPPRHAGAASAIADAGPADTPASLPLAVSPPHLPELQPEPGRWIWTCPPGHDWADWFAGTLARAAAAEQTGLAVVPDARDVRRLVARLLPRVPAGQLAVLSADAPAATRYADFQAALQGRAKIVVGTRSAAFAPLTAPDLLLLWDDGDDSHSERRAPYPHAREVLAMRSTPSNALVIGGYGRSTNAQRWLEIGWAVELPTPVDGAVPPENTGPGRRRTPSPRVTATMDDRGPAAPNQRVGRLPATAGAAIRDAVQRGPVLIAVGRPGYVPRLRCAECRNPADCRRCGGPLALAQHGVATCSRCGRSASDWSCPQCHGNQLRSSSVGSERTAEELGRAFPNVPVLTSAGDRVRDQVADRPALVIATPGAEPVAERGYAAVVVLDMAAALAQPGLRSAEQAARRWFTVGALARPGAPMVLVADPAWPVVQALLRWDPGWFASRELLARQEAGMPPARRAVSVEGRPADLSQIAAELPLDAVVLGPVPTEHGERILITVPPRDGAAVVHRLREVLARQSAEGAPALRVRVDPPDVE